MHIRRLATIIAIFACDSALASPPIMCETIHWRPGIVVNVDAQLYQHVDITLPEYAMDVIWGTKDLWETDWIRNHIFLKPLTSLAQGRQTTLTAVGQSNNTYEFLVHRVAHASTPCYILTADGGLIHPAAWAVAENPQRQLVASLLQRLNQVSNDKVAAVRTIEHQARQAVKKYRQQIYTRYQWNHAKGWFADGGEIIDSVYDDGRFTYVRLTHDNRGLMSIYGKIDGRKDLLQYTYDERAHLYQISGIFPEFIMRSGESEITIKRLPEREG